MTHIRALQGKVIVSKMLKGERKVGSIVLMDDNGKEHGVRPRWCQVYAVGPDVTEATKGQWVYVEHGRWTRPFMIADDNGDIQEMYEVERKAMMLISDEVPADDQVMDTKIYGGVSDYM